MSSNGPSRGCGHQLVRPESAAFGRRLCAVFEYWHWLWLREALSRERCDEKSADPVGSHLARVGVGLRRDLLDDHVDSVVAQSELG